jgi:hypothetical protein
MHRFGLYVVSGPPRWVSVFLTHFDFNATVTRIPRTEKSKLLTQRIKIAKASFCTPQTTFSTSPLKPDFKKSTLFALFIISFYDILSTIFNLFASAVAPDATLDDQNKKGVPLFC